MLNIIKNQNTSPGILGKIYAILHSDIDVWPAFTPDTRDYTGDFTLVAGKVWSEMQVSKTQGEFVHASENAGSQDNPAKSVTVTAFVPGIDGATSHKLQAGENLEWVLLVPIKGSCESGTPKYRVVGGKCGGVDLVTTWSDDGSKMGYTPVWVGPEDGHPALYTGAIVT